MTSNLNSVPSLREFIENICGDGNGFLSISNTHESHLQTLRSNFFAASDIDAIENHLKSIPDTHQVVFNVARLGNIPSSGRGKTSDAHAFSVIGMDIDVYSLKKANQNLPKSIDEAIAALETLPLPPSILVASGTGLHAYWKLSSDVVIGDSEDLKEARLLVADFYRGVAADLPDYSFDPTKDLARTFRMPGFSNLKEPANPKPVTLLKLNQDRSYTLEQIVDVSVSAIPKERAIQIAATNPDEITAKLNLEMMAEGCAWVADALKHGSNAKYETWWAMGSLFSKVENGRELFHQWSSQYPGYDPDETDAKFDQVDPAKADRTCVGLSQLESSGLPNQFLGGMNKHCFHCRFREGINSPVELGIPGIRTVTTNNAQLRTKAAALWTGVHVNNNPPSLFSFNNEIARVKEKDASIEILDTNTAKYEFARQVNWMVSTKNGWGVHVDPSQNVINHALAEPHPPLPKLKQVVSIPVVSEGGKLVSKPGFDKESGIFYAAESNCLPELNLNATKEDAVEAIKWINEEVLHDFPLIDDASRAAALSIAILPFVRLLINGATPLYLLDKPTAGTGATTLGIALCYPFIGKVISVTPWTSTEDERRKQITAHLSSGGGPVFYDNMSDYINSDHLASALTNPYWSDRLLQTSRQVEFEVNCTWLATGNNPEFHNQLLRRIVNVRLVSPLEDPALRNDWKHVDLIGWIAEHRQVFVEKILTVVIAWLNAGKPMFSGKPLASYVKWSAVMGGILEFAEVPGFLTNIEAKKAAMDSQSQILREFIEAWLVEYNGEPKSSSDILTDFSAMEICGEWDAPTRQGQVTKVGRLLARYRDKVFVFGDTTVQLTQSGRTYYLKTILQADN